MGVQYKCDNCGKRLKSVWKECPDCRQPVQQRIPMTIGTIGHVGHGKTALTSAITNYCENKFGDGIWSDDGNDIAPDIRHLEYRSSKRIYTHVDYRDHGEYVRHMIKGKDRMDGAILVVSARDAVMPQTIEHVMLVGKTGTSSLIVFLNKIDLLDYPGQADLVEKEIREILNSGGYDDNNIPFIRGSALKAVKDLRDKKETKDASCIEKLLNAMDNFFCDPCGKTDDLDAMNIDDVFDIEKHENAPQKKFKAIIYCLSKNENGRQYPVKNGERLDFYFDKSAVSCTVNMLNENNIEIHPGTYAQIICSLENPAIIKPYLPFSIRDDSKTIAFGQVLAEK
ncbi:MAG: hypothetical protein LBG94_02955 [Treponema sp.]|jgi:translation elongation factor EF-Tu-like GTPase|nr:hypothetical protein [Treponema sp.]